MASNDESEPLRERASSMRFECLQLMLRLQRHGGSLTRLLPEVQKKVAIGERARLQAWAYGWSRWWHQIDGLVRPLLQKPLKSKDLDVFLLMHLGVYQLRYTEIAPHAAVHETVKLIGKLKKPWGRGLVNAVLREYQRKAAQLESSLSIEARYSHPSWLAQQFKRDWGDRWEELCQSNNRQAPMTLRVNARRRTAEQHRDILQHATPSVVSQTLTAAPEGLILEQPVGVDSLPGFQEGVVSVQDAAAQLAAGFLANNSPAGGRLLDACAAPGGKTAHAAELGHFSSITALDQDAQRLDMLDQTLHRLALEDKVHIRHADASQLDQWWDGKTFDAVLLDAPCSGTGVIRRHPDIKLLRRESDLPTLIALQAALLTSLWQTVAPSGLLLYATCSVIKDENHHQVDAFLERTTDASLVDKPMQILPGEQGMDGFFYAMLRKRAD